MFEKLEGRPCGTQLLADGLVIHYTCNSPGNETLKRVGILPIGSRFGVEPREVLLIPQNMFSGLIGTVEAENLLRNLEDNN